MSDLPPFSIPLPYDRIRSIEERPFGLLALDEHFIRSPNIDVFFVFVEKVGCTFIKHLLVHEMIGDISTLDPEYYLPGLQPLNLVHALSHEALRVDGRAVLASASATTITFCRNPYSRFVSAFVDKILNPPALEISHFYWIRREILFRKARFAVQGNVVDWKDRISIHEFAEFVRSQNSDQHDKHWAEQWLLNLADIVKHRKIVRLEEFGMTLPKIWKDHIGRKFPGTFEPIRNHSSRERPVLNEETAEIIYDIYRKDFTIFDYDPESWQLY